MGQLQKATKLLSRAARAVELTRDGWSGQQIAAELGVSDQTICNYLKRFTESQSLFGSDLTPEEVSEYRALRRERLLANEERLIATREQLWEITPADEGEVYTRAAAISRVSDSITKNSVALADLDGLPVKADAAPITNQQNNLIMMQDIKRLFG